MRQLIIKASLPKPLLKRVRRLESLQLSKSTSRPTSANQLTRLDNLRRKHLVFSHRPWQKTIQRLRISTQWSLHLSKGVTKRMFSTGRSAIPRGERNWVLLTHMTSGSWVSTRTEELTLTLSGCCPTTSLSSAALNSSTFSEIWLDLRKWLRSLLILPSTLGQKCGFRTFTQLGSTTLSRSS